MVCWIELGVGRTWKCYQQVSCMHFDPAGPIHQLQLMSWLLEVMLGLPRKEVHWTLVSVVGLAHQKGHRGGH